MVSINVYIKATSFLFVDYVSPTEHFQIGDHKKKR